EVPVQLSREHQIARGCRDGGQHRSPRSVAPTNRAGRGIDGGQPAVAWLIRIGSKPSAHVIPSHYVLELVGLPERAAPIHRDDVQHVGPWVEGRTVPLNPAQRAGAGAYPCRRGGELNVLSPRNGHV